MWGLYWGIGSAAAGRGKTTEVRRNGGCEDRDHQVCGGDAGFSARRSATDVRDPTADLDHRGTLRSSGRSLVADLQGDGERGGQRQNFIRRRHVVKNPGVDERE